MGERLYRKLAVLAKIETTEGTDAAPTGSADAMQMSNVTLTPLAGNQAQRGLLLPYLGNQGIILTGNHVQIKGDVEIAGAGDAGTVPGYGALLRACGLAETVTADTDVKYAPISSAFESVSLYYNADGVNHIALGSRGTFTVDLTPGQIPHFTFTLTGLLGTISDTALPTADLSAFAEPVEVSKANTTMTLQGWTAIAESLSLDIANSVTPRFLIGKERVPITDRQSSGTAVVEAASLATKNWFQVAQDRTRGALAVQHGTEAGNIVKFDAPAVEIGRPTQSQTDGVVNYSLPLLLCPDDGDDELSIAVK